MSALSRMDGGMASNQIAPHTSSIHRKSMRRSCGVGARNPTILRSGAGLVVRWTGLYFFAARGPSDAVQLSGTRSPPQPGSEWGPDTVRLPRRRRATHCGRTSLCTQPQLMAAWHSLLCSDGDVHTKIEVSINRIAEQTHRVGLDALVPTAQTMVGRVLVGLSV
ncbi:hypothetical protein TcCL_NonESM11111 [Trypanosoma cruzi]|nr:hypothetical protein TcCL_NonESM11111 [Trypanosoma cruzi]